MLTVVAWAAGAALLALTWLGRTVRAPSATLSICTTFLPWLYILDLVLAFGLWVLVPDRRSLPALQGLLVVVVAGLWGPGWAASPQDEAGDELVVMSWNVRRLYGGADDGGDPAACVARVLEEQAPDVVVMPEISQVALRKLEERLPLRCGWTDYRGRDEAPMGGIATCVQGERWSLASSTAVPYLDDDDWHYLLTEVEREGRVVNVLGVHLSPYAFSADALRASVSDLTRGQPDGLAALGRRGEEVVQTQGDQSIALLERLGRLTDPTVVAGDFNSTPHAFLHVALRRVLVDTFRQGGTGFGGTYHFLDRVPLRIDYVYATPDFRVAGGAVPDAGCSDHLPVRAALRLP